MIGLGRAVTLESASPDAITRVRRAWEATPASSLEEGTPSPRPVRVLRVPLPRPLGGVRPGSDPH